MAVEEATAAEFRTRFPEFSATTDAVVERLLEEAEIIHVIQPLATLYLAAHLAAKFGDAQSGQSTGGVGEITGEYAASPPGAVLQHRDRQGSAEPVLRERRTTARGSWCLRRGRRSSRLAWS